MLWIGIAIVIGTFWLIYKNYEARLVLFLSGIGAGTEVSFVFETEKPRSGITGLEDKLLQAEGA